jgi:hypothetical protein
MIWPTSFGQILAMDEIELAIAVLSGKIKQP